MWSQLGGARPEPAPTASEQQPEAFQVADVENLPFDLLEDVELERTEELVLPVEYDIEAIEATGLRIRETVRVFMNPELTVEAPDAFVNAISWNQEITVHPEEVGVTGIDRTGEADSWQISEPGEWGFATTYYVAQTLDPTTGAPLARPLVTRFTVAEDEDAPQPAAPAPTARVDGDGVGHLTWEPVEGASTYAVLSLRSDSEVGDTQWVVGLTDETEWTTLEDDTRALEELAREDEANVSDLVSQNDAMQAFDNSEDDLTNPQAYVRENVIDGPTVYGVIAISGQTVSPVGFLPDSRALAAQLPHSMALYTQETNGLLPRDIETIEAIPTHLPVTMVDGRTVMRSVVPQLDLITESEVITADVDDAGNYSNVQHQPTIRVPFVVEGTLLTGSYDFITADMAADRARVAAVAERNTLARAKTGAAGAGRTDPEAGLLDGVEVSDTLPAVEGVRGTNSLTEYLAANLLVGNEYVDVTAYLDNAAGITVEDALGEALWQNPGIPSVESWTLVEPDHVVVVRWEVRDEAERLAEQEEVAAEVRRVVEGFDDGLSATELVKAVDDHLSAVAAYDYDALAARDTLAPPAEYRRAWAPAGVLLDGRGVCESYAEAFQMLATAAGLESMVVTGVADGTGHAWNKVRVDGVWRVVDPTWNDGDVPDDEYLLLTDAQASATRTEDRDWVVDALVGNYAAV